MVWKHRIRFFCLCYKWEQVTRSYVLRYMRNFPRAYNLSADLEILVWRHEQYQFSRCHPFPGRQLQLSSPHFPRGR